MGSAKLLARDLPGRQVFDLDVIRLKHTEATRIIEEARVTIQTARIWHSSLRSLNCLARFPSLTILVVASWPGELDVLARLSHLTHLRILHFPKATSLAPLASLEKLESICLETLPGWDGSSKKITLDSLEPIATLTELHDVCLRGRVCFAKNGIEPLAKMQSLQRFTCGRGVSKVDIAAFRAARPDVIIGE